MKKFTNADLEHQGKHNRIYLDKSELLVRELP